MMFLFVCFNSLCPINNLSVIKGQVFLGWTSNKLGLMFLLKDTTQWGSNLWPLRLELSTLPLSHCPLPSYDVSSNNVLAIFISLAFTLFCLYKARKYLHILKQHPFKLLHLRIGSLFPFICARSFKIHGYKSWYIKNEILQASKKEYITKQQWKNFLTLNQNKGCGYWKEPSQWDGFKMIMGKKVRM